MSELHIRQAWLLAGSAILISAGLLVWGRGHAAGIGANMPLSITIIPQDAVNLDCSNDANFSGTRCNYDSYGRLRDDNQMGLRPYVTTGRELFLLAGVFEQGEVQQWLTRARYSGNFARVTVDCQATLLGKLDTVAVRWQAGAAFANESSVPVARVSDCHVSR
jgi:hypothetical protein